MKPLIFKDEWDNEIINLSIKESGDFEYPFEIEMNDGLGKSSLCFSNKEAEAIASWLQEALPPNMENK